LRIATEVVDGDPGAWNNPDREGVKTDLEYSERTNGKQKPEGKEEK
jgi:hypothetical protein